MIPTANSISCPRCHCVDVTPLARENDRQRYQCLSCSENFWSHPAQEAPKELAAAGGRFAHVPISIPDAPLRGAGPAGKCPKCLKPYFRLGKRYEEHVSSCSGKPYIAPRKRGPRGIPELLPDPAKIYDQHIAALRAKKAALEAEIMGIDLAIAEIEKKKGVGGAAPVPFPTGSPAKPCSA